MNLCTKCKVSGRAGTVLSLLLILFLFQGLVSCKSDGLSPDSSGGPVSPGNDPNFKIVANSDGILKSFNRKVVVFGVDIYAVPEVEDRKLLHAANVLAQYLDNDEDGAVDNQAVMDKMLENRAFMVMWKKESDLNEFPSGREGQDLGNDETHPSYVADGCTGEFDAALEEVLHIVTHAGYSQVYPAVFGEKAGSALADAMDLARGGRFTTVPKTYPAGAWYTYDDRTCEYGCQITEYYYWALTSLLGAQANRLDEIGQEWKLNTPLKVKDRDPKVFQLLTDPRYKTPSVLPDGTYRH